MYVYVDVLIILNIYVNYFLIKATAKITHTKLKKIRCILSCILGSITSLLIFLPKVNIVLLSIIRIVFAVLIIFLAFDERNIKKLLKLSMIFFIMCFVLAGVEYGISIFSTTKSVFFYNSIFYVNISLLTLVVSTIAAYILVSLFRYFMDNKNDFDKDYFVVIRKGGKQSVVKAKCDTCNNLTDAFTGKPVIVCNKSSVRELFSKDIIDKILHFDINSTNTVQGWRLIPFNTVNSDGLIPCFKPDEVYIKDSTNSIVKAVEVYIGVVDRQMDNAIFNPKIMN